MFKFLGLPDFEVDVQQTVVHCTNCGHKNLYTFNNYYKDKIIFIRCLECNQALKVKVPK